MSREYFGTDGVRGRVGKDPMTADFAMRLASAAAQVLVPQGGTVVIGKDTRLSGYMFESALEAGLSAAGVDIHLLGPMPTPAISFLTSNMRCDVGVVISASHNPFQDNGIKIFSRDGFKLPDAEEDEIEKLITTDHISPAGSIKADSPAGQWLMEHQVAKADFNSYGARRGHQFAELAAAAAPRHPPQHRVGAALDRQVQVRHQARVAKQLPETVV